MEIISDWLEAISDWDIEDFEQAIIYLGFIGVGLLGIVVSIWYVGYRIYAFSFLRKGPSLGRMDGVKKRRLPKTNQNGTSIEKEKRGTHKLSRGE